MDLALMACCCPLAEAVGAALGRLRTLAEAMLRNAETACFKVGAPWEAAINSEREACAYLLLPKSWVPHGCYLYPSQRWAPRKRCATPTTGGAAG